MIQHFSFLWLAYFIYNVVKDLPCCSMPEFHSFLSMTNVLLHAFYVSFFCSFVDGYLGCLYILAVVNTAAMNMRVQLSFHNPTFNSITYKWNF
jgi:hypothetical protein